MSITRADSESMNLRETLTEDEQNVIDKVMSILFVHGRVYDVPIANDDRCVQVEAAMIRLIIASRK
jgi:hypothetical protein